MAWRQAVTKYNYYHWHTYIYTHVYVNKHYHRNPPVQIEQYRDLQGPANSGRCKPVPAPMTYGPVAGCLATQLQMPIDTTW